MDYYKWYTYNDQNFDVYKNSVDFINKYISCSCLISVSQVSEIIKKNTSMLFVDLEDILLIMQQL